MTFGTLCGKRTTTFAALSVVFAALFGVLALSSPSASAQIYYEIGGGPGNTPYWSTVNVYNPLTDYYWTCRHEYVLTKE